MPRLNLKNDENYFSSPEEILKYYIVDTEYGLDGKDAKVRLKKYGKNILRKEKEKSFILLFLSQLHDGLIYVLLTAVAITLYLGSFMDAGIILGVIFVNAIIGTIQEKKADHAIEALKKLSSPHAIVKRDGIVKEINATSLVPGDIVLLEVGRYVPADLKIVESSNLQIDESLLTGESIPSQKDPDKKYKSKNINLGDRKDLAFMSTLITHGRGLGIVVKTGMDTQMGKIAKSIDKEKETKTPLEIKMTDLGKKIGIASIIICFLMFVIASLQGRNIAENFLMAVSLAVASIPEGLAAIVAIVLSIGVTNMSKQNAIVRKLYSVESLGSVNVVCSDKTGTLTLNKMTVSNYFSKSGEGEIKVHQKNEVGEDIKLLAKGMALCNDATYEEGKVTGDPTEIALLYFAQDVGLADKEILDKELPRVGEFPFDSNRKLMSTIHKSGDKYKVYTKGAVENLLEISTYVLVNGKKVKLTKEIKQEYLESINNLSNQALRTLGLAYKETDKKLKDEEMENNLILVGMVAMIDPPRTEVKNSILEAKKAGIKTMMITGDYKNTAFAIAKKLNISKNIDEVITGQEIEGLTDEELKLKVKKCRIFARVSPEHKVRIVRALQAQKNMVAMIGDGVNDAPSLSAANIGVSMGSGTDVAKGAAEIILTDDNFGTIINAINSGRNIYNNIKKSINFLLSSNIGEVISVFISVILGLPIILTATQLLWINLLTDSLPAIALGMEPGDDDVMKEKPRKQGESFFSKSSTKEILFIGLLIGLVTTLAFYIGYKNHNLGDSKLAEEYGRTMAFFVVIASQLTHGFSLRHETKTIFQIGIFSNIYLIGAVLIALIFQIVLLWIPQLRTAFGLQLLDFKDVGIVIGLGILPLIIVEIKKFFTNRG